MIEILDNSISVDLAQNGFSVFKLLEKTDCDNLMNFFKELKTPEINKFQTTVHLNDVDLNHIIDNKIKEILLPKIEQKFASFNTLNGIFYIKPIGKESEFYLHRDWSIVEEEKYTSYHIWVALEEITIHNGALFFLERHHKDKQSLRGSPKLDYKGITLVERVLSVFKRKIIEMTPGDAVIFEHSLRHGSLKNKSNAIRLAAGISIVPKNAPIIHYHQLNKDTIGMYQIDKDFYLDFNLNNFSTEKNLIRKFKM